MRIISWNVNGIARRFAQLKELIAEYQPDFVCIQKQRSKNVAKYDIDGYRLLADMCDFGGWSGVMTYWKNPLPDNAIPPIEMMPERIPTVRLSAGGHLQAYRCNGFILINAYAPFANPEIDGAVNHRALWNKQLIELVKVIKDQAPIVICGDLNIVDCHIDTHSGKAVKNQPCYNVWEHRDFDELKHIGNLVDSFRALNPDEVKYTYFYDGLAQLLNDGDRIDYALVSKSLMPHVTKADIFDEVDAQSCPIILEFNLLEKAAETKEAVEETPSSYPDTISVQEAARWMARLAACDGAISSTERKILSQFAKNFGLDSDFFNR